MPYNQNIPQAGDRLNASQPQLLANFQAIQTLVAINHGIFGAADEGKHKWISFPTQGAAPVFLATEEGLYNFVNPTTTKNETYIHKQTQAGTSDIPFTASILSNTAIAGIGNGWTYLPSGILLKWGQITTGMGVTAINGGAWGPNYTRLFCVVGSPNGVAATYRLVIVNNAAATIQLTGGAASAYFIAIGV